LRTGLNLEVYFGFLGILRKDAVISDKSRGAENSYDSRVSKKATLNSSI